MRSWSRRSMGHVALGVALLSTVARCTGDRSPTPPLALAPPPPLAATAPLSGDVLVGTGSIARCDRRFDEATAAILDTIPGTIFTAGDNIFASGSAADFTNCFGASWGRLKARIRPAVGDVEYKTSGASGYFGYFGAAAGDPTKGYYSYDFTDWHVVVLNSGSSSVSTKLGTPQEQWLRADLAANTKRCVLAYWHHPRFSSSGTAVRSEIKPLWDDLYAAHADVVINDHYRIYERFAPQTSTEVADPVNGIRQFIVGTGGGGVDVFSTTIRPNSEVRSSGVYGVLKLVLGAGAYTWQFIPVAGQTFSDAGTGSCHSRMPVASVSVSPPSAGVPVGGTVQLTATLLDAGGNLLSGRTVAWQSSDAHVATVSAGIVVGQSEGSATITATSEGQSGSATITVTALPPGSPLVLVGAGDIASCTSSGDEATATLLDAVPGTVFTAGDNAYDNGAAADYSQCYEPSWGRHKARTRPAPGNHEYGTTGATGYFDYYGSLAGDYGKGYYSYDIGDWHIISLNSNIDMSAGSPEEQWLRADLAASTKQCTIAYWHHPRFSSGTKHGSQPQTQALWQALYDAGAEIVISGHEHNYERFVPQTPTGQPDPGTGIREFVVGTGGESHYSGSVPLPTSQVFNGTTWGVLKLTLAAGSYSWLFIPIAGDTFTDTGSGTCHTAPSTLRASSSTITASNGSSPTTITVTVRDAVGNAVSGASVAFAATGSGNLFAPPGATTDASGVVTATFSSTVAEAKTVTATANAVAIAQTASVTVNPSAAAALAFAVQPGNSVAGASFAPAPQVEIRDQFGNRVTGATSSVTLALGSNAAAGTLSGTTTVAATAGVATFSDLHIDQAGTGFTLHATSGSLSGATSTAFDVANGSVSPDQSSVSATPASFTAGAGGATILVTARDGGGHAVSGATVSLSATGSGNTFDQPAPTDATGVATGTLRSTGAGTRSVSATVNGVIVSQKASVTVTAAQPDANRSGLTAAPSGIVAGSGAATITVTARDAFGNPINGAPIAFAATGSGNMLTPGTAATDANGVATSALASTDPGTKVVSATAGGVTIAQTASVAVTAPGATQVFVGAGSIASCSATDDEATASILDTIPGTVFTAGDNVTNTGALSDFTGCYAPSWGRHRARTRPTVGYKDYQTAGAAGYWQYFGTATGDSGKYYYSYDLGSWHIVVLNERSADVPLNAGSVQEKWLKADLAATTQPCILALWAKPRFSSSATSPRSNVLDAWNDLYAAGADVILNADYRNYERFAPQKPDGSADPVRGIRQFVVGTGGRVGFDAFLTTPMANSEVRNSSAKGVLKLTLGPSSYSWQFIPIAGNTFTDAGTGTCH